MNKTDLFGIQNTEGDKELVEPEDGPQNHQIEQNRMTISNVDQQLILEIRAKALWEQLSIQQAPQEDLKDINDRMQEKFARLRSQQELVTRSKIKPNKKLFEQMISEAL